MRAELEARNSSSKGLKSQLIARLIKTLKSEEEKERNPPPGTETPPPVAKSPEEDKKKEEKKEERKPVCKLHSLFKH